MPAPPARQTPRTARHDKLPPPACRAAEAGRALAPWVGRDDWPELLNAYGRCLRIVRSYKQTFPLDPDRFVGPVERALYTAYQTASAHVSPEGSVDDLLSALRLLIPVINRFFDDVLVMADDGALRQNRLALLPRLAGWTMILRRPPKISNSCPSQKTDSLFPSFPRRRETRR